MAAVQMNTRIDSALKKQGDASFAEFGYSPSEAVRLVWGFAARNRHNRRAIADFINGLEDPKVKAAQAECQVRIEGIKKGPELVRQYLQEIRTGQTDMNSWTCEEQDEQIALDLEEDEGRIRAEALVE